MKTTICKVEIRNKLSTKLKLNPTKIKLALREKDSRNSNERHRLWYLMNPTTTEKYRQKKETYSRMQPESILQTLFSDTKHLINSFTISVEMKGGRVSNMLSSFRTLIYVGVHERKLWKFAAQFAKCRKYLTAHSTPENTTPQSPQRMKLSHFIEHLVRICLRCSLIQF